MKAHKFHLLCSTDQGTAENKQNTGLIPEQLLLLDVLASGMHLCFLVDWCLKFAPRKKKKIGCTGVDRDLKWMHFQVPFCCCHCLEICNINTASDCRHNHQHVSKVPEKTCDCHDIQIVFHAT